jgi:anti-sigma factor RsiW
MEECLVNTITCQAAAAALLEPELPAAAQAALTAHLAACPACRAEAAEWALLRQCWHETAAAPPPDLADRVMAAVTPPAAPMRDLVLPALAALVGGQVLLLIALRAAARGHLELLLGTLERGWAATLATGPAASDWVTGWAIGWATFSTLPGDWLGSLGLIAGAALLAALAGAYYQEHRHA